MKWGKPLWHFSIPRQTKKTYIHKWICRRNVKHTAMFVFLTATDVPKIVYTYSYKSVSYSCTSYYKDHFTLSVFNSYRYFLHWCTTKNGIEFHTNLYSRSFSQSSFSSCNKSILTFYACLHLYPSSQTLAICKKFCIHWMQLV